MRHFPTALNAMCVAALVSCSSDSASGPSNPTAPYIVYGLPNGAVYRVEAKAGGVNQNVTTALNALGAGRDEWLNVSPDGALLVLATERFDAGCAGFVCLALVKSDISSPEVIKVNGQVIHPAGFGAVANSGNLIVYEDASGSQARDLWVITRSVNTWSAPLQLTAASPYDYNSQPALSADGSKVVFDCGPVPYGGVGTAICEVGIGGTGFRVVLTTANNPPGTTAGGALHHADYAPDGSIVFEGDWDGERIWRLSPGTTVPVRVQPNSINDNSPCVLSDGRIASLWLNRPGNGPGNHELKVMVSDGSSYVMALTGIDVLDGGIGCGG